MKNVGTKKTMKRWRGRRGEKGAALVEFAIVLPVLMIVLMGIVEFGLLLYNQHVITNASREGARYGIVVRTPRRSMVEIDSIVMLYLEDNLFTFGDSAAKVDIAPDPSSGPVFGDDLTVDVTFHYDFLVLPGFLGNLFGGTTLQAHTTMKYE